MKRRAIAASMSRTDGGYSREGDSKDNLAPPSRDSSWRQMISVQLDNGDNVGVPEPWEWPDPFAEITVADLQCRADGHR